MAISNITRLDAPEGTGLTAKPRKGGPPTFATNRSSSTHTRVVSDVGFNGAGPSHQGRTRPLACWSRASPSTGRTSDGLEPLHSLIAHLRSAHPDASFQFSILLLISTICGICFSLKLTPTSPIRRVWHGFDTVRSMKRDRRRIRLRDQALTSSTHRSDPLRTTMREPR
jgi:hypothetical protein